MKFLKNKKLTKTVNKLFLKGGRKDEEINSLALVFILVFICFLFTNALFIKYILWDGKIHQYNTEIDYSELSYREKKIAQGLIAQLKPEYLNASKSIKFTHEIIKDYPGYLDVKLGKITEDMLWGYNHKNEIYIKYLKDRDAMKRTICHELLHSITLSNEDYVRDLEDYYPCYKRTLLNGNESIIE